MEEHEYYVGVDVGTSSVRAGLVSPAGRVLHVATRDIIIHNPRRANTQEHLFCIAWDTEKY